MQAYPWRLFCLMTLLGAAPSAPAQTNELVSVSTGGPAGNDASLRPSISGDGRFVVFESAATNLVPYDTNWRDDVFIHDRLLGITERLSVATDGTQGDGHSRYASVSDDGRFVAFESAATHLVPDDTNNAWDVFVHDRLLRRTERVSVSSEGVQGTSTSSDARISGDGRYVVFLSSSSNLVPGDTNNSSDIFVRDRLLGTTELASVASDGTQGSSQCFTPDISADGRFVTFRSHSNNLVPGDTNGQADVFVRDRLLGLTERVNVATDGTQSQSTCTSPRISACGTYVVFQCQGTGLAPEVVTSGYDVYVHNRHTRTTELVSFAGNGTTSGDSGSSSGRPSGDGRYVVFSSHASDILPGAVPYSGDAFVRDRVAFATARLATSFDGGVASQGVGSAELSADGRYATFASSATNLVAEGTNGLVQVYVRELPELPRGMFTAFCSGYPGNASACPCDNAGDPGRGCGNGTFPQGARLAAAGLASVTLDSLVLQAFTSAPEQPGLFFQGDEAVSLGHGQTFGDGLRCADSGTVRLDAVLAGADGSATSSLALAAFAGVTAGSTVRYQWWYRDPDASPCGAGFNLSNGLEVAWGP